MNFRILKRATTLNQALNRPFRVRNQSQQYFDQCDSRRLISALGRLESSLRRFHKPDSFSRSQASKLLLNFGDPCLREVRLQQLTQRFIGPSDQASPSVDV